MIEALLVSLKSFSVSPVTYPLDRHFSSRESLSTLKDQGPVGDPIRPGARFFF